MLARDLLPDRPDPECRQSGMLIEHGLLGHGVLRGEEFLDVARCDLLHQQILPEESLKLFD